MEMRWTGIWKERLDWAGRPLPEVDGGVLRGWKRLEWLLLGFGLGIRD